MRERQDRSNLIQVKRRWTEIKPLSRCGLQKTEGLRKAPFCSVRRWRRKKRALTPV